MQAEKMFVGGAPNGGENVTISGVHVGVSSSALTTRGELQIAGGAGTQIEVKDGGLLQTSASTHIWKKFDLGKVFVHGQTPSPVLPAEWISTADIFVGGEITLSELVVEDGGSVVTTGDVILSFNSHEKAMVSVSGTGSVLSANDLVVGVDGDGELEISNGAQVTTQAGTVGRGQVPPLVPLGGQGGAAPGSGVVRIGSNLPSSSEWHVTGDCSFGDNEPGLVTLSGLVIGPFSVIGATLRVDGTLTVGSGGTINGSGTLATGKRVVNGGFISPGFSPGIIVIEGDYEQTLDGVFKVEVAGLDPGKFDVLKITGNATLAGSVELHFLDGFLPKQGDSVDFVQISGNATGQFTQITFPDLAPGFDAELRLTPDGAIRLTARTDAVPKEDTASIPPPNPAVGAPLPVLCGSGACGTGIPSILPILAAWTVVSHRRRPGRARH